MSSSVSRYFLFLLAPFFLLQALPSAAQIVLHAAQPTDTTHQEIPSVRLAKKKFGWNRRVFQNLVTRDNYYFNANYRLDELLNDIAASQEDDYSRLLPMYPYPDEALQPVTGFLDSVITEASVGIQIHDPRSKWIDNLYLLAGKAYFYKKDYANALAAFQYINTTWAPREKGADAATVIGTRGYTPSAQISIATKEKRGSLLRHQPSRNDALLWMIRTYIASAQYDPAESLLSTLRSDPGFPERLNGSLAELQAWYFFRQGLYPRCMQPLAEAVAANPPKAEKTRWEFILGQLAEENQDAAGAITYYQHVLSLHPDPLMAFYSRLNIVKIHIAAKAASGTGPDAEDENMAVLLKMTRKDKYERYRGILFYALGQFENQAGQAAKAADYLSKSIRNSGDDSKQKALSYLLLADIAYGQADYIAAKKYYDSTAAFMPGNFADAGLVNTRKKALAEVVSRLETISRQDSLQRVAAMPEDERRAFLEKILAAGKKQNSKAERSAGNLVNSSDLSAPAGNSLASAGSGKAGDWYFDNEALKSAGFTEFRNRWGNRPLADNWRLSDQGVLAVSSTTGSGEIPASEGPATGAAAKGASLESLLAALPMTPEKRRASDDSIIRAWYELGSLYHDELDNLSAAVGAYDSLLKRYPDNRFAPESHYILYLLYGQMNDDRNAASQKEVLLSRYPGSRYAAILRGGGAAQSPDSLRQQQISQFYDSTYLDYLTGDYAAVIRRKLLADSLYGAGHALQPKFDLLEAMAIVKTQPDSAGRQALERVIAKDARDEAITGQARAILDALNHRQQLIDYLSSLQVPPANASAAGNYSARNYATGNPANSAPGQAAASDTSLARRSGKEASAVNPLKPGAAAQPGKDTAAAKPPTGAPTPYVKGPDNAWFVALEFERTDKQLLEDALGKFARYNLTRHAADSGKVEVSAYALTPNKVMLIFRLFSSEKAAMHYFYEIKREAPVSIIPEINPLYYQLFIISKNNFILLNNSKDLDGYLHFFKEGEVRSEK